MKQRRLWVIFFNGFTVEYVTFACLLSSAIRTYYSPRFAFLCLSIQAVVKRRKYFAQAPPVTLIPFGVLIACASVWFHYSPTR